MMEVMGVSHRVAVMCRGHLAGILEGDAINEHEIMRYATGLKTQSHHSEKISA
jgi:ribose transport system ATP-binding protein